MPFTSMPVVPFLWLYLCGEDVWRKYKTFLVQVTGAGNGTQGCPYEYHTGQTCQMQARDVPFWSNVVVKWHAQEDASALTWVLDVVLSANARVLALTMKTNIQE